MVDPSESGANVNPVAEQLKTARNRLLDANDREPGLEAAAAAARNISGVIERGESNPQAAYKLRRVTHVNDFGEHKTTYLLQKTDNDDNSEMFGVVLGFGRYKADMQIMDPKTNPYYEYASNNAASLYSMGIEDPVQVLDKITSVYEAIAADGVRIEPGEYTIDHKGDMGDYLNTFGFSGRLPSTEAELKAQYDDAQSRVDAAKRRTVRPAIPPPPRRLDTRAILAHLAAERPELVAAALRPPVSYEQPLKRTMLDDELDGESFQDGLTRYAQARQGFEAVDRSQFHLAASMQDSAHALMWTEDESGHIVPGPIFEDPEALSSVTDGFVTADLADSESLENEPITRLTNLEEALTNSFITVVTNKSTGKEGLRIPLRFSTSKYTRGEPEKSAGTGSTFRGHSMRRDEGGNLLIEPDEDTTFTDFTVTLADPDEVITADMLDRNGDPVIDDAGNKKTITTKPLLRARLIEEVGEERKTEKTSFYRTPEGVIVICAEGSAKCYPSQLSAGVSVTRKPVIYLYPQKKTDVQVKLKYQGKLTNTYPQIVGNTWKVKACPDGTLQIGKKYYKYLFWDGVNRDIEWDWSEGFCIHKNDVDDFLEEKMELLGLNFAEAQDFITYWAPLMKQNIWSLVSFQTEKYEELAKLHITPKPDTLLRVFMVFKASKMYIEIPEQIIQPIKRKGFIVVEWGGSNLDELDLKQHMSPLSHLSLLSR